MPLPETVVTNSSINRYIISTERSTQDGCNDRIRNNTAAASWILKCIFSPLPPPLGFLSSLDDFYLLGSGLLMTQTSIGVFNVSLFSQLSPHSLLAWQRVRLANSLAHSGEEWAHIFSKYNSGEFQLI